jgi:hypothetical protein
MLSKRKDVVWIDRVRPLEEEFGVECGSRRRDDTCTEALYCYLRLCNHGYRKACCLRKSTW